MRCLRTHTSLAPLCCIRKTRLVFKHGYWHDEAWHVDIKISCDRKVLSVQTTRAFASRAGKHVVRLFQQALCSPFVMSKEAPHFHRRILVRLASWFGREPGGPTSLIRLLSGEGGYRGRHQISFGLEEVQRTGESAGILKAYKLVEVYGVVGESWNRLTGQWDCMLGWHLTNRRPRLRSRPRLDMARLKVTPHEGSCPCSRLSKYRWKIVKVQYGTLLLT